VSLTDMNKPAATRTSSDKRGILFLIVMGLFGLGLGFLVNILDPFIYTAKVRVLAPPHLKNTVLGGLTIVTLVVALLVQPLAGWLSDRTGDSRWGRRVPYLAAGTVGVSLGLAFIVVADSLWLLVLAAVFLSASSNTVQGPWQALIPDQVPRSQHGRAAGVKTLLELVGVVAGVAIIGVTVARGNLWGASLAAMGIFFAILAITIVGLWQTGGVVGQPARSKQNQTGPKQNNSWLKRGVTRLAAIWRTTPPSFPWWMLNRFLFWSAGIAIRTFLLNYMEDVLGMPPAEAQVLSSRIFLVLGGGVFFLAVPAGALADRWGRRPLLMVAGFLAAGGAGFFLFANEIPLLFVGGSLIAVGGGIFASASWSLATNLVPSSEGGQYLALANVATVLGSIGGRMGGPLIDAVNQLAGTVTLGYLIVFGLATLFFALSSLAVLKISD